MRVAAILKGLCEVPVRVDLYDANFGQIIKRVGTSRRRSNCETLRAKTIAFCVRTSHGPNEREREQEQANLDCFLSPQREAELQSRHQKSYYFK